jgi:hypothetical protein
MKEEVERKLNNVVNNQHNTMSTITKKMGLLLVTIAISLFSFSQNATQKDSIDILLDNLFFSEPGILDDVLTLKKQSFIYTSATYNTNTYFSGRDSGIDQYSFSPQVSFYHHTGISLSCYGIYYQTFSPNWDYTGISLGYNNTIGKLNLGYYYASYSRYFYNNSEGLLTNSIDFNIGIRNKKQSLGTSLATSYLFGESDAWQVISNWYGKLPLIKKKEFALKIHPQLSFIFSKQTIELSQFNSSEVVDYDIFGIINTQLNLPLSFTWKDLNMDIAYHLNIPTPVADESDLGTNAFFSFSIGYLFSL